MGYLVGTHDLIKHRISETYDISLKDLYSTINTLKNQFAMSSDGIHDLL